MIAEAISPAAALAPEPKPRKIPQSLVRETIDGIPFYYAGFRSVLNHTKKIEDIMADSGLQGIVKAYLFALLIQRLDLRRYQPMVGEIGSHLDHRSNMGLDVVVYDQQLLTPTEITGKYIKVPPKVVIEVDVRVELEERGGDLFEQYVLRKTRRLFAFGTERIIWIFTRSHTVIVARPGNSWDVLDWDAEVEIMEGITFNIAQFLAEKGIVAPKQF